MKNKLTNNLTPYEIFLMEAAGENTEKLSEMSVELKIPKNDYSLLASMHIPSDMNASELLNIISANELVELNLQSGNIKLNEHYRTSGELENRVLYNVHTSNPDKTAESIKNFNHRNESY